MSSNTRIVDAKSEPVSQPISAGGSGVPIKIDTTQMQQALQSMVNKQMQSALNGVAAPAAAGSAGVQVESTAERINPSIYMDTLTKDISDLYARFDKLKKLAVELHGKQVTAPLPDHVSVKNIVINFAISKNGKEEEHSAEIKNVAAIGDLTPLLSTEFGFLIMALTEQSKQLEDIAHKTTERCSSALREWENNNKDKKIVTGGIVSNVTEEQAAGSNSTPQVTLGPT